MNLGDINKGIVALLVALVLGAGGYLWFSQMYKPALALRTTAQAEADSAQQALTTAEAERAEAQRVAKEAEDAAAKPDTSLATLAIARGGVPPKPFVDDAAVVLWELAKRSGISTSLEVKEPDAQNGGTAAGTSNLQGAKPIDVEFEAAGTYSEMMNFMDLVEGTVTVEDGQLFQRGRLFNVVSLKIGGREEGGGNQSSEVASNFLGTGDDSGGVVAKPGEVLFTIVVRMYTSSTENAQGVGAAVPDPAAAATTPGAAGAPGATDGATPGTAGTPGPTTSDTPSTGVPSNSNGTGATPAGTQGSPTSSTAAPAGGTS